jgi:hypothetical protein
MVIVAGTTCAVLLAGAAAFGYTATADRTQVPGNQATARSPDPSPTASPQRRLPTSCQLERLAVPNGHLSSLVTGGDPTGRYLLGRSNSTGNSRYQVIVWDNGVPQVANVTGLDASFDDINSWGVAVGSSFVGDIHRSWLYRDGKVTALPGSPAAHALAVGETGILVGGRRISETATVPVMWPTPDSQPIALPVPAGWTGSATQVAPDGTIVGVLQVGDPTKLTGYVWAPNGTGRPIVPPAGAPGEKVWFTPIVFAGRSVIGSIYVENATTLSFTPSKYNLDMGTFTPIIGRPALLVSPAGWGVTEKILSKPVDGGPPPQRQMILVNETGEVPMPYLHTLNHLANLATTISDDGLTIGGQSNDATGRHQAVVWRCS